MRYFFHVRTTQKMLLDEIGTEHPDAESAHAEAVCVCRQLALEFPAAAGELKLEEIRVTDEMGVELFTVPVGTLQDEGRSAQSRRTSCLVSSENA